MDQELTRYINDHLAGSSGALVLVEKIATEHAHPDATHFFQELLGKIHEDRAILESLLEKIRQEPSLLMKAAGSVAARVGGLKLLWEKIEPGELGMFEALEMLALGVQGKRLLWVAMAELQPWYPEWKGIDFANLELEAIQQRDGIEEWRVEAAREALISGERKKISTKS